MCTNLIKGLQNTKTDRHKGKIHNHVGDFNTPLSGIDRQKQNKTV